MAPSYGVVNAHPAIACPPHYTMINGKCVPSGAYISPPDSALNAIHAGHPFSSSQNAGHAALPSRACPPHFTMINGQCVPSGAYISPEGA
jgi:hypothetical protein